MLFEDMGIPPGYGVKQLLFSPAANVLVLQIHSAGEAWRPERLYFRGIGSDKYSPIGAPSLLVSQERPCIHSSKPLVAFNQMQHKFSLNAAGEELHSGDWHSLEVVSLETGLPVRTVRPDTLRLPSEFRHGWIYDVVAFGDHGLFVNAGLSYNMKAFVYFIAQLDESGELKPLVELPAVFL